MQEQVRRVLDDKGGEVHTTTPDTTVIDAVTAMNDHGIGALVVMRGSKPVGMFTERDVLRRVVAEERSPTTAKVGDVMSTDVVSIGPDVTVEEAMSVITQRRCRHLPVIEERRMLGLISSGDLTKWVTRNQARDIQDLVEYINGPHARDSAPPPVL
ncbi:MAG: CBS domain-containing protein [Myxococcota bacterium]